MSAPFWANSRAIARPIPRVAPVTMAARPENGLLSDTMNLPRNLQLQRTQILPKLRRKFRVFQSKLYGSDQETELVAGVVTNSLKTNGVEITLFQKRAHRIRNLDFADRARFCLFDFGKD